MTGMATAAALRANGWRNCLAGGRGRENSLQDPQRRVYDTSWPSHCFRYWCFRDQQALSPPSNGRSSACNSSRRALPLLPPPPCS
eukprot:760126-Hanusia_phi.AAC.2